MSTFLLSKTELSQVGSYDVDLMARALKIILHCLEERNWSGWAVTGNPALLEIPAWIAKRGFDVQQSVRTLSDIIHFGRIVYKSKLTQSI